MLCCGLNNVAYSVCDCLEPRRVVTHSSFVQQRRHAEDVVAADVGHGALDDALAALQTAVALEGVPGHFTFNPIEHVHLPDPRDQHQLHSHEKKAEQKHRLLDTILASVSNVEIKVKSIKVYAQSQ